MSEKGIRLIATHPTVKLNFPNPLACWQFARFYYALQSRSETLLSLLDVIEHYRCAPIAELVKEMKA